MVAAAAFPAVVVSSSPLFQMALSRLICMLFAFLASTVCNKEQNFANG